MSEGTGDPLNIENGCIDEKVEIIYRPYDEFTQKAEEVVSKWKRFLRMRNMLHGELGYSDELQMLIAEELRKENKTAQLRCMPN